MANVGIVPACVCNSPALSAGPCFTSPLFLRSMLCQSDHTVTHMISRERMRLRERDSRPNVLLATFLDVHLKDSIGLKAITHQTREYQNGAWSRGQEASRTFLICCCFSSSESPSKNFLRVYIVHLRVSIGRSQPHRDVS